MRSRIRRPGSGRAGELYVTLDRAVAIYRPDGEQLEMIDVPEPPANMTFVGLTRTTLFITASTSIYTLEMAIKGAATPPQSFGFSATPDYSAHSVSKGLYKGGFCVQKPGGVPSSDTFEETVEAFGSVDPEALQQE